LITRILSQGHFDGFCLLYAILNSYKAFIKPDQTACVFVQKNMHKWRKIIFNTPSLHQFASGEGSDFGVATNKLDIEVKKAFIETCFKLLTERTKNKIFVAPLRLEDIQKVNFTKGIIILCLKEKAKLEHGSIGDHWVVLTENDSKSEKLNIACSYTQIKHGYKECKSSSGRYYNNSLNHSELKNNRVWQNSIYLITNDNA